VERWVGVWGGAVAKQQLERVVVQKRSRHPPLPSRVPSTNSANHRDGGRMRLNNGDVRVLAIRVELSH
jgi:hypothetical protein